MNTNALNQSFAKYGKLSLFLAWTATTLIYLKLFGIFTNLEAVKYINEAHRFLETGSFSAPRFWFYSITIFILAIAFKLKIGITGAFILQSLLNLFAYHIFFNALTRLFKNSITPLCIVLYLLLFSPYQSWVVFLYSESAFFSLILILFSILVLYKPDTKKNLLLIGVVLVLVILARPLGILFAGSTYLYLFYLASHKWKKVLGFASLALLAAAYYSINIIFSTIPDWHITQAFEQESIICNLPATPPYATLNLTTTGSPVFQLWYYLSHNFAHFLHFSGVKLKYFFLMARPYYSKGHNYFLLVNTTIIYFFMIAGLFLKHLKFERSAVVFATGTTLLYTITIIFQCDDYHNRFVLSIYPLFVVLSARTIEYVLLRFFKHYK